MTAKTVGRPVTNICKNTTHIQSQNVDCSVEQWRTLNNFLRKSEYIWKVHNRLTNTHMSEQFLSLDEVYKCNNCMNGVPIFPLLSNNAWWSFISVAVSVPPNPHLFPLNGCPCLGAAVSEAFSNVAPLLPSFQWTLGWMLYFGYPSKIGSGHFIFKYFQHGHLQKYQTPCFPSVPGKWPFIPSWGHSTYITSPDPNSQGLTTTAL